MIDGSFLTEGAFLPDHPLALLERGEYNKVPELIGVNEDDASLFAWLGKRLWFICLIIS